MPTRASSRFKGFWLLLLPLLCWPACSSSGLSTVRGSVTHKGTPIKGAVVFFHPKGDSLTAQRPSAVTDANGSFSLTTGARSGAPAGDYLVTVIWPEEPKEKKTKVISTEPEDMSAPDRLAGRYSDPKTSNLSATVTSGHNRLDPFDLK